MGCSCGKKKGSQTLPAGFGKQAPVEELVPKKGSGAKQKFTLQTSSGKTAQFGSKLEAQAARVRAGGGTIHPLG